MAGRRALITGITGQDGSYLAELLLEKDYEVFGMTRRASTENVERIAHLTDRVSADPGRPARSALPRVRAPHLGAARGLQPRRPELRPDVVEPARADGGVHRSRGDAPARGDPDRRPGHPLLPGLLVGDVREGARSPADGATPFHPRSPYGVAKAYGHYITVNYRESYGLYAVSGILFNHESPRRGLEFSTRKISDGVARIKLGLADELVLGNLDAERDWGFAGDYVDAMWQMLQQDEPADYVVATGETHSVREFADLAFGYVGLDWEQYVKTDPQFLRPAEVDQLVGDASKAKKELGWEPKHSFRDLVEVMVDADLERVAAAATPRLTT